MKLQDKSTTDIPHELFISPEFEKIIIKMNPEITGIRKNRIEIINQISFSGFTYNTEMSPSNNIYFFRIGLLFGGGESTLKGDRYYYSHEINKWFKYSYPLESKYISFDVDEIEYPKQKSSYQRLLDIF